MIEGKITIELAEDDRARLDKIADLLAKLSNADGYTTTFDDSPFPATVEKTEPTEPVKEEAPFEADEPKAEAPAYKLEDVQQKVVQLSATGKKAEARDIVKAYAEKVSAIPADKFGEVMSKLSALEG